MNKTALATVITGTLLMSSAAIADEVGDWYLTPMISAIWVDSDRPVDDDFGGHLGIGKVMSEKANVEIYATGASYTGFDEQDAFGIGVDYSFVFYRYSKLTPYFLLGVGYLETDSSIRRDTGNLMTSLAFGILTNFERTRTKLRTEIRYRSDWTDDSVTGQNRLNEVMFNFGLQIPLGN